MEKTLLLITVFFYCFNISYAQPGELDPSFGINGIVKTDLGVNYNYGGNAKKVLVQPDGSIYIITDRGANISAILKKHPDGTADLSYGDHGSSDLLTMTVNSGVMQPDGKIIIAGSSGIYLAIARYNTDGSIDRTFGADGVQKTSFDYDAYAYATSIAIGSDGKIVVLGNSVYLVDAAYTAVVTARYTKDGTLDDTFNGSGKVRETFGDYLDANSVAIQSDGKILVSIGGSENRVLRYNTDGSHDNNFNDIYTGGPVAVQSDGKILVGNNRFDTNGEFDSYYNTDFSINSISIQTDGKIIVAGNPGYSDSGFVVGRYTPELEPDSTFNSDGKQITKFGGGIDIANSVAIQSDGKIVVAGYSYTYNNDIYQVSGFALARYNVGGSLDKSFDGDGKLTGSLIDANTIYTSTAIQRDGKLVAAGKTWNGSNFDFALARYNVDGSLDNTFSGDGKRITDYTTQYVYLNSIAIQSDGKIVMAGSFGEYLSNSFIIVRYNIDGSLDKSFSGDGIRSNAYDIKSVALQSDGKIVVAGNAPIDYQKSFTLSRLNSDGSFDNTFGVNGTVTTTDFARSFDYTFINAVTIQKDGKIVAAGGGFYYDRPGFFDLAIVRYNTNGSLDNTFSDDGIETTYDRNIVANAVAIQSDGTIVAACNSPIDASVVELATYNTKGDFLKFLQLPFGTDFNDHATSLAIQSNDKILVAGNSSGDFAIARCNKDISLDSSFSGDGIQITDASPGNDGISGIAISGNKLYAAGFGQFPGNFGVVARYLLQDENKPPIVNITSPANNAGYVAPSTIHLIADAKDEDGTIKKVQFYNGNILLETQYEYPYGYTWRNVPAGNYTFTAKATDDKGMMTTSAVVKVTVLANKAPVVSITSPGNNISYVESANIHLIADAKDFDGIIKKVQFYNGATLLATQYYFPYGYTWRNVPAGNYTFTAKATDDKGVVTISAVVKVSVLVNKAPIVSITSPANNSSYTGPAKIRLIADAKDSDGLIKKVQFYNGTVLLATEKYFPYTYTWNNVQPGTYNITAKATDDKGVVTTSAVVQVSVIPPNNLFANTEKINIENENAKIFSTESLTLKASPNPVKNILNIYTTGFEQSKKLSISVVAVSGVVIKTINPTSKQTLQLDVSSLRSGAYYLKVISGDKVMYTQFVKL